MFTLHDTRTGRPGPVVPAGRRLLRMYSCGPAAGRRAHAGDLRAHLLPDLIRRNSERHNLTVLTCQNVTDPGRTADDGGAKARYQDAFRADCSALNLHPPDHTPRASESVGLVIGMISRLLEAGHAYATPDGSVFFDARSFPGYGEISGARLAGPPPGRDSGGEAGQGKRFHADWALWAGAPSGPEPATTAHGQTEWTAHGQTHLAARPKTRWAAPWGTGSPGPHAECSAVSLHYLGEAIDIHTGGIDLRFPHHENERAQSNSVTGHEAVSHWVHGGHLLFDGAVMAAPAGNVVLLTDLAERDLDPLALRLALLEYRYRQQMDLTWDDLTAADATLTRWRDRVAEWANSPSRPMCAEVTGEIGDAFDDDLDTPAALNALRKLEKDSETPAGSKFETFAHADRLLGLDLARDIGRRPAAPAGSTQRSAGS